VLLLLGYGLVPLGVMVVSSQVLLYILNYRNFRHVVPGYRFDPRGAKLSMLAQLVAYGKHTFLANTSWEVVNQGPAVLIGHFLPTAYVGYYAVPTRLIQVSVTVTDSVISVSGSNTAELMAKQEMKTIPLLGVLVNRYCLALFMPIAIILWIYRNEVIHTWIRKSAYVSHSAPLLPILLVGAIWVLVGQVNTAPILYGLGKHQGYARGVLVEACLSVLLLVYTIPHYGLLGAASVAMGLMILNRGVYLPWYLCRVLQFPYSRYMAGIYTRPLLAAIPLTAVIYFVKAALFRGHSLLEIAAASVIAGGLGWGLGFFTALEPEHRALLLQLMTGFPARLVSHFRRQPANV
jgi:O-antigen/teichoic acid export membrane protein